MGIYIDVSLSIAIRKGAMVFLASTGSGGRDANRQVEAPLDLAEVRQFIEALASRNADMTDDEMNDRLKDHVFKRYLSGK